MRLVYAHGVLTVLKDLPDEFVFEPQTTGNHTSFQSLKHW